LLGSLSKYQRELIKGPIVDMDNHFNEVFSSFNPLNPEFAPGCRIIDNFSSCFAFNLLSKCYDLKLKLRLHLGKDLRKDKRYIEVVKHKDTG